MTALYFFVQITQKAILKPKIVIKYNVFHFTLLILIKNADTVHIIRLQKV